jgi:hypothetical protein
MVSAHTETWANGYESAIDEAIRLVDSMRGPGTSNLATPILLRIRAELIALRETAHAPVLAA